MANKDKNKKSISPQASKKMSSFEEMERWFDEFLPSHFMHPFNDKWPAWPNLDIQTNGRFPKVDLIDREKNFLVRAELPGVRKEDLDISLTEDVLTIKATTRHEEEEKKGEYYRREISRGEFQRSIKLPCAVVADQVKSSFKDGVLELEITKEIPAKRKTIKVE